MPWKVAGLGSDAEGKFALVFCGWDPTRTITWRVKSRLRYTVYTEESAAAWWINQNMFHPMFGLFSVFSELLRVIENPELVEVEYRRLRALWDERDALPSEMEGYRAGFLDRFKEVSGRPLNCCGMLLLQQRLRAEGVDV